MKIPGNTTVQALNTLLQGELTAVAGYKRALSSPKTRAEYRPAFEECLSSHRRRVLRLQSEVVRRGGIPVSTMARTWDFLLTCFAWASQVAGMAFLSPLLHPPGNTRSASLRPRLGPPGCPRPPAGVLGTVSPTGLDTPKHVTGSDRLEGRVGRLADLASTA
jgi:hypothetical protein